MINHTNCHHERTSSARAKCRRGQVGFRPPLFSLGPPPRATKGSTPKDDDDRYGQVPRDRHLECDNCGVERIAYRGTDPLTGIVRYVGERCLYTIKRSDDTVPLD